jgi:two-component system chemotaxis response regulator CheB
MNSKVKVLIVDDSAFARRTLTKILEQDPRIQVIGTAWDGREALEKIQKLKPDVVTLDIVMPKMTGLEALDVIIKDMPTPVIVVSSLNPEVIKETLVALERGAIDFILKPAELPSEKLFQIKTELINKVITAASLQGKAIQDLVTQHKLSLTDFKVVTRQEKPVRIDCVAIGVSTGGPAALNQIIPKLPEDFPAGILIVQHMPAGFTTSLAERMNRNSQIEVKEAEEGDIVKPGRALIAPGGFHMSLERKKHAITTRIHRESPDTLHVPSIDITFNSVADIYGERSLGIILTGMGKDGVQGLQKIKQKGGHSIAEDESTCVVFGMPQVAINMKIVDKVAPIYKVAEVIMEMV